MSDNAMGSNTNFEVWDMEVCFDQETKSLIIIGNEVALRYLGDYCHGLIHRQSGSHVHIDQVSCKETGEIVDVIIQRR
jgi:hypothetical protein